MVGTTTSADLPTMTGALKATLTGSAKSYSRSSRVTLNGSGT
jgi:hypothetical protein